MVEEDEEAPVDEPGPLLQSLQVAAEGALVDELLQPVEVLERGVPVLHQDLGGELPPHAVQIVLVSGLNKAWIIISAANRLIGEVVQSRRRPLLGPSPG